MNFLKNRVQVEYLPESTHIAFYDKNMEPVREISFKDSSIYYTLETLDWIATYVLRGVQLVFQFIVPEASVLFRSAVSAFLVIPSSSITRSYRCFKMGQLKWWESCIDIIGETIFKLSLSVGGYFILAPLGIIGSFVGATAGQFGGSYLWNYIQEKVGFNNLMDI